MLSKRLFLASVVLFVLLSLTLISSVGASLEIWSQTYGGEIDNTAYSVVEASDGGFVIAGSTTSIGPGSDFWLVKTDAYGNMEWNQTYGGEKGDGASAMVATSDGGYAIAGFTTSFGAGYGDFWLVKTDANGNMEWNQTYGGPHGEIAYSLVETSDGGYALAGGKSVNEDRDFWLVKTDQLGNMEWNQTYGGQNSDMAISLVQTIDGGYVLAGKTDSFGAGDQDFWLVKTDANGNMEWNKTYGGTEQECAYSLVVTSDGGYAIAGKTYSFGAGGLDFWLIKTDAAGNMEWNQTYGGTEQECAYSLVVTSDGGYAIAGETYSFGAGGLDFWLVKTDLNGNMEWNQTYGGPRFEVAHSLIETSDGGYALAGTKVLVYAGAQYFCLVKTDERGIPEFPSWIILPLFLIATLSAIIVKKRLFHQRS